MTKQVLNAWNFDTAEELVSAMAEALDLAKAEGHDEHVVCCENKRRMTLVRETLTDGSHVMNLYFFDGE